MCLCYVGMCTFACAQTNSNSLSATCSANVRAYARVIMMTHITSRGPPPPSTQSSSRQEYANTFSAYANICRHYKLDTHTHAHSRRQRVSVWEYPNLIRTHKRRQDAFASVERWRGRWRRWQWQRRHAMDACWCDWCVFTYTFHAFMLFRRNARMGGNTILETLTAATMKWVWRALPPFSLERSCTTHRMLHTECVSMRRTSTHVCSWCHRVLGTLSRFAPTLHRRAKREPWFS